MAITQIPAVDVNQFFDDLTQAELLNNMIALLMGRGHINATFSNMETSGQPVLLQGSTFECGNVIFAANTDTPVTGSPVNNAVNYIYYDPDTNSLLYSSAQPSLNPVKGGWYNGNNRAIVKFHYSGGAYNGKTIMTNSGKEEIAMQPIPDTGGTVVYTKSVTANESVWLSPGAYRFALKGGDGGAGGAGGTIDGGSVPGGPGSPGQNGGPGQLVTGKFYWEGGSVNVVIGGNGFRGGKGGKGFAIIEAGDNGDGGVNYIGPVAAGGGGGGGAGEDSVLSGMHIGFIAKGGYPGYPGSGGTTTTFISIDNSVTATRGGMGGYNGGNGESAPIFRKHATDQNYANIGIGGFGGFGGINSGNGQNGTDGADTYAGRCGGGGGGSGGAGKNRPMGSTEAGSCTIWKMW